MESADGLVNTIQQYGIKALDKLRVMFGVAVWDEKEQTLMLVISIN
nr:hypothetical protein [uncultured Blautia sp.]